MRESEPVAGIEWFVVEDAAGLARLEPEWRRLAETVSEPVVFAAPAWALAWWRHFGAGRHLHLAGARRDGRLVALAPLCTTARGGLRVREFLGSEEADVGTLLLAPGEEELAPALARFVVAGEWDLLDLWCVPEGSPTARALQDALAAGGVGHETTTLTVNPVLDVRPDEWAAGASRSMLKDLARQRRVLGREGKLEVVFPADAGEVEAGLEDLRAFHQTRWSGQGELSRLQLPAYWAWVRGISLEALRQGWLYLPRLVLDGRLLATGLYFLYGRRLFYWMGAHDHDVARHSPNMLLTLAMIEHLRVTGGADVLDFGRGDEWYKLRWTQSAFALQRLMAWRGVRGRALYFWRGRVRPWAWAHQDLSRPLRRLKRIVQQRLGKPA